MAAIWDGVALALSQTKANILNSHVPLLLYSQQAVGEMRNRGWEGHGQLKTSGPVPGAAALSYCQLTVGGSGVPEQPPPLISLEETRNQKTLDIKSFQIDHCTWKVTFP